MKRESSSILATTTVSSHHEGWKINFQFYIYTLFLDCFSFSFVKIRWELSEIRGTERLIIDKFGHDFQQPSP